MATNPGDRFVRRHDASRGSTANATAADITYDTSVISDGSGYTYNGPDVEVDTAGFYLFVFDIGQADLASTRACGTLVPRINGATDQTRFRATHRYLRNSGGQQGASIGMCILDLSANDDVRVRNPGVVAPTDAGLNYATNSGSGGGLQLLRLPDGNLTHVERTVDAAEVGTSNINTTRPWVASSGTWTKITYDSEVQDDNGLYSGSGGDVTLAANTKYMIVWGATIYSTDTSRHTNVVGLSIAGDRVQTGSGYHRNTAVQGPPICGMYLHETGGSAETLFLEATHESEGGDAGTPQVSDAYLQIIELPSTAEWIHVDNGATDSLTTALAGTGTWYDTPLSSTLRADGGSNLSLDAANDAVQNDAAGTLSVLAIGWHRWDRDSAASGTRKIPWTRWNNGGSALGYGVAGAYSRGQQGSDDNFQAHYCSAVLLDLASADDLVFQVNDEASGANSDMGVYASTSRYFLGVQVLNLSTLVASTDPNITDVESDEDFRDGDASLTITGENFEAVQGTGTVEIGPDSSYGGTKVAQTVTSWGDASIDFTAVLGALTPGVNYLYVTNDTGDRNAVGFEIQIHRKVAWTLSASSNIAASGEATTAQLTAPSGKTTGDFDAGRTQDDENPTDSVTVDADGYTEHEWAMEATADAIDSSSYEFRLVQSDDTALTTYSVTPTITLGSGGLTETAETASTAFTVQDAVASPGAVSETAEVASAAFTAQDAVAVGGAVSVAAETAAAAFAAQDATTNAPIAQSAETASAAYTAQDAVSVGGAVSASAETAAATFVAQDAVAIGGAVSVAAETASATYAAADATIDAPITESAEVATATYAAQDAASVGGAVSVSAETATGTYAAQDAAAAPGAASVAAETAGATYTAQDATTAAGATTETAETASATFTAQDATVDAPITESAETATASYAAQDATAAPGTVSVAAETAAGTYAAQDAEAVVGAVSVSAETAGATFSAQDAVAAPGAVSVAAETAGASFSGQDATGSSDATNETAETATASFTAQDATAVPGIVSVPADTAVGTYTAQDAAVAPGAVSVVAETAGASFVAQDAAAAPGAASVAAETATAAYAAQDAEAVPNALAETATATFTGQDATAVGGAVSVAAETAQGTFTAQDAAALQEGIAAAETATAAFTVQDATTVGGAVAVQADTAGSSFSAQDAVAAPGEVTAFADTAGGAFTAQGATATAAIGESAETAAASFTARDAAVSPGQVDVPATTAEGAFTSNDATVLPGAISVAAETATATFGAQDASSTGDYTAPTETATGTFAAQDATASPGAISVAAETASASFSAQDAAAVPGAVLIAAQSASALFAVANGAVFAPVEGAIGIVIDVPNAVADIEVPDGSVTIGHEEPPPEL